MIVGRSLTSAFTCMDSWVSHHYPKENSLLAQYLALRGCLQFTWALLGVAIDILDYVV